jgi:nitrogen fixation/metabolism regulation signal transduction histidine kinase
MGPGSADEPSNVSVLVHIEQRLNDLERLSDERDKRYEERDVAAKAAVTAALVAQDKLTAAAFAAAKEAVTKAEIAQGEYNIRSNEFRGQLADQAKDLMPRKETEALLIVIRDTIERLREEVRTADAGAAREVSGKFDGLRTEIQGLREARTAAVTAERYVDPLLGKLAASVEKLETAQHHGQGKETGMHAIWFAVLGVLTVVSLIVAIATGIYSVTRSSVPVAPVYAPVPGGQQPVPK